MRLRCADHPSWRRYRSLSRLERDDLHAVADLHAHDDGGD